MALHLPYLLKWGSCRHFIGLQKKSAPRVFLVALKKSRLSTLIFAECVIFCTFLNVKGQGISKMALNYCICHSLQSGASFPEIAIGYGSPGILYILIAKKIWQIFVLLEPILQHCSWNIKKSTLLYLICSNWIFVTIRKIYTKLEGGAWTSLHPVLTYKLCLCILIGPFFRLT